ncbi:MAG: Omp28-related outer membrane protein [Bacteroidia bacterium]
MKKSFTLISSLLLATSSFAQSQRTILAEEFTQASCGPCAAQNPAYNALLRINQDKVISLKYQTSWPGTDPMNAQNPTDVQTRVNYYNVGGVPDVEVDGNYQSSVAPSQVTQPSINSEYPVTSPYSIALSTSLNAAKDSIFITMAINCTQAVSGTLMARVAIVENFIQFASAPGTNGEKEFQYNIMRKMLPNANGTTLATTWTVGQTQTLTFAEKIPTYIYNKNQLAVVAFIQDDNNKNVKQAAYCSQLNADASIAEVTNLPTAPSCAVNFTPTVKLINKGKDVLTSAIITPTVDGVVGSPINWTGSLNTLGASMVALPTVNTTVTGAHTFAVVVTMPNAMADVAPQEDNYASKFYLYSAAQAYPYYQEFSAGGFPYTNWIVENIEGDPATWTKVANGSAGGTGTGSVKIDFYNSPPSYIDNMYLPTFDMSAATATDSVKLDFKVAGASYLDANDTSFTSNDMLNVEVSNDCGATWIQVWSKSGAALYTTTKRSSAYTPVPAHFRNESINLDAFKGQSNIIVRFNAYSDYGNNVYVDKINLYVATVTGVKEIKNTTTTDVYPNPTSANATVRVVLNNTQQVAIEVVNVIGEKVITTPQNTMSAGEHNFALDTQKLSNGVYMVNIITNQGTVTKKLIVNK